MHKFLSAFYNQRLETSANIHQYQFNNTFII